MVSFNSKFGLCSNCSQKLHGGSLARAHKIFATARMLAFSLTCARLLEISFKSSFVVIFYTYINDKSCSYDTVKTKRLKHPYLWLQSFFN